jgi:MarR family transcriptional regulator, organic hydroperoxide resistance regulator
VIPTAHSHIHKAPKPDLENVDPLTVAVFHAFGRVMHLNRLVMMRTIAQRGIQPPEAFALTLLRHHDGVSQRELAAVLHLSPPRVSMILGSLEKSGAVVRRPDETDRRLTRVYVTPEGRRRENEHRAVLGDYVNRTIGTLCEDDRRELARLLTELADRTMDVLREEEEGKSQAEDAETR